VRERGGGESHAAAGSTSHVAAARCFAEKARTPREREGEEEEVKEYI
jgi:hypothetical protein